MQVIRESLATCHTQVKWQQSYTTVATCTCIVTLIQFLTLWAFLFQEFEDVNLELLLIPCPSYITPC